MPARTKGFRDRFKRADHYKKHKYECGGATNEREYEQRADKFLCGPLTPSVSECNRRSGDLVRYDVSTGEFGCLSPNGFIRTYKIFQNKINGLAYFKRQCARIYI